jgi:hypothetical protein
MDKDGYLGFFTAFAEYGCEWDMRLVLPLMEMVTVFTDLGLTHEHALLRSMVELRSLREDIPYPTLDDVDRRIMSEMPDSESRLLAIMDIRSDLSQMKFPFIVLWGQDYILRPINIYEDLETGTKIRAQCLWESVRQQISRVSGLTCPFREVKKPCCGAKDALQSVWARLPKNYRAALHPPTCH